LKQFVENRIASHTTSTAGLEQVYCKFRQHPPKLMPKPTLFVCQSCHISSEERPDNPPTDGDRLLEQLNTLADEQSQSDKFEIQAVGCLWTCDNPALLPFPLPTNPLIYLLPCQPMKPPRPFFNLATFISTAPQEYPLEAVS
jgi:hypothetical protein